MTTEGLQILHPKFLPPTAKRIETRAHSASSLSNSPNFNKQQLSHRAENYLRKNSTTNQSLEVKFQKKQIPEYFDRISDCRPQGKAIVRVLRCDPSHANQKKVRRDHKKLIDPKQMYDTNAAGEPSFKIKNSQIRVVPQQGSKEYTIFFDRKRRTDGPKTTEYMHNPTTLITGGVFPEDAKIGIRYQTEKRPQDHQDVITYEYSGGICPPKGVSAVNSASLRHERANYEQLIRNAVSKQHEINKAQYNYFKASRSSSSLVFSDFLYDRKD